MEVTMSDQNDNSGKPNTPDPAADQTQNQSTIQQAAQPQANAAPQAPAAASVASSSSREERERIAHLTNVIAFPGYMTALGVSLFDRPQLTISLLVISSAIQLFGSAFSLSRRDVVKRLGILLGIFLLAWLLLFMFPLKNYFPNTSGVAQQTMTLYIPEKVRLSDDVPDIHIGSVTLQAPHVLQLGGTSNKIPTDKDIWFYVLATDNWYYLKDVRIGIDNTWTSERIPIGDINNAGGKYTLGVFLYPKSDPKSDPKCPPLVNGTRVKQLPACAAEVYRFIITR
jgi:hypothetical protein